ncbi:putative asparagine synthase [Mycena vitilis]|nr:putative asparagine synthase [Mycena vitilis]
MCGIATVYHSDSAALSSVDNLVTVLESSLKRIRHRGPDSTGIYVSPDARVGLGHVRLSIIDPEGGQQPLSDEDNSIHCVVTGEIYDHERIRSELEAKGSRFKTKSDSELVVQLYKHEGFNLLSSLRGEFAFVLFDSKRKLLFAARDRFGIKPLYYTLSEGRLLIASEMKAFMPLGWKAGWDVHSIIHNADFCDDRTVFTGVRKVLMPGSFLLFRPDGYIKTQSYWDPTYADTNAPNTATLEEMITAVRERLFDAVRLRLRSDVPLGLYLSGGIDSAAIAGIATALLREKDPNAKLATFTLAFRGAGLHDEGPIAGRTAAFIGADAHMVELTEEDLVNAFEATIWHAEQPSFSLHGPGRYLLSKFVREKGYKVVLSGEGADEFFAGYSWFPVDYLRQPDPAGLALGLDLPTDAEREAILNHIQLAAVPLLLMSANSYTDAGLGRRMLGGISTHRAYAAAGVAGAEFYNRDVLAVTGDPDATLIMAEGIDARVRANAVSGKWHPLSIASYLSAKTFLQGFVLNTLGERTEMSHSIEGRPPFLDHHVVEYVNTLPPSVKVRPIEVDGRWTFTDKWILRQAVQPYVTEELFLRKKAMYNAPPSRRSAGDTRLVPLQAHLKRRITKENVERLGFFGWQFLGNVLTQYLSAPEFPADGSLDRNAQFLLYVLSFIVMQERFHVDTWVP